ncbi:MAG: hypothetical protein Ct9H300mP15_19470 [Gemmatimonadota bacterium]|nr:MAG: hypothetical protein Ct9H300mP15_19470 [Gemmatimonadota bacterium]
MVRWFYYELRAFIELERGVEGFGAISEMSWTRNIRHPSKVVEINEEIEGVVPFGLTQRRKNFPGMKQIEEDPWLGLPAKYPKWNDSGGKGKKPHFFGHFRDRKWDRWTFHVSDMSWTKRVQHPSES